MAVASTARPPTPTPAPPPARLGSLWSTLEDQRGAAVQLLSSAWTLPTTSQPGDGEEQRPKEGRRRGGPLVGGGVRAAAELWAFARADPRKPVFAGKVALALALISLLVFLREPRDIVSHSVWAILTVVVVFEFSIALVTVPTRQFLEHGHIYSTPSHVQLICGSATNCRCIQDHSGGRACQLKNRQENSSSISPIC